MYCPRLEGMWVRATRTPTWQKWPKDGNCRLFSTRESGRKDKSNTVYRHRSLWQKEWTYRSQWRHELCSCWQRFPWLLLRPNWFGFLQMPHSLQWPSLKFLCVHNRNGSFAWSCTRPLLEVSAHITKSAKGNGFACLSQFHTKPCAGLVTSRRETEQRAGGSNFLHCKSKS